MEWIVPVVVFAASLAGTGVVLRQLQRRAILDHPNERSSHTVATPRGGGIAVVVALAAGWLAVALIRPEESREIAAVSGIAVGLAVLSWFDDLGGLPVLVRLLAQVGAIAAVLVITPGDALYFAGLLPAWLDVFAAGVLWVWFVNLFNFMDGIDGIAGTEMATIGLGVTLVAVVAGVANSLPVLGLTMAAAAIGFLRWNWHPAKIFLGDVGSVPLGFLLGWLLLTLAARGQWAAALILPAYYLADATWTLLRRLSRGERVWQAHREHFYQRAVQAGRGHSVVVLSILAANVALVGLACLAARGWVWEALGGATLIVGILLHRLGKEPPAP
jgi:UDP-N-acetylmuramyl pentapeptide phosphotransferase/UDP-N-acetylglucosamine-1-phosphate transferase